MHGISAFVSEVSFGLVHPDSPKSMEVTWVFGAFGAFGLAANFHFGLVKTHDFYPFCRFPAQWKLITDLKNKTTRCEGSKNSVLFFSFEELMRYCPNPTVFWMMFSGNRFFCTISAARRSIRLPGVSSTAVSCTFLRFAQLPCRAGSLKFIQCTDCMWFSYVQKIDILLVSFLLNIDLVFSLVSPVCSTLSTALPRSNGTASDEVVLLKMARKTLRTPAVESTPWSRWTWLLSRIFWMFKDNEFQVAFSLYMHLELRILRKVEGLTAGHIEWIKCLLPY